MAIVSQTGFGSEPTAIVLAQDRCLRDGIIDREAWRQTVFVPMSLVSDGKTHVIADEADFEKMMDDLQHYATAHGITHIRTRISAHIGVSDNVATIPGLRDHMAGSERIATASMTFSVMRDSSGWRINQIHFNDHTADLSAMTQILRQSGED